MHARLMNTFGRLSVSIREGVGKAAQGRRNVVPRTSESRSKGASKAFRRARKGISEGIGKVLARGSVNSGGDMRDILAKQSGIV